MEPLQHVGVSRWVSTLRAESLHPHQRGLLLWVPIYTAYVKMDLDVNSRSLKGVFFSFFNVTDVGYLWLTCGREDLRGPLVCHCCC